MIILGVAASARFGVDGQTDAFFFSPTYQQDPATAEPMGLLQLCSFQGEILREGQHAAPPKWEGPAGVGNPVVAFPYWAGLAASAQFGLPNQTDVFAVSTEGQLMVAWVDGALTWGGPMGIGGTGVFPAGAPVAASAQFGVPNQTDVFAVSTEGQLMVAAVQEAGEWAPPMGIGGAGVFPQRAALAASAQFGVPNQTDVFAVSNEGQLMVAWVDGAGKWAGPAVIGNVSTSGGGYGLAASAQFDLIGPPNRTDVFIQTGQQILVTWVDGAGKWTLPGPIATFPALG
ncbi:hypothetical protein [Mycobacterium sp.]|uniref:hypothetical protein n=1 Tax=Mycobacterium sp. TaxID=1785 RepID=UPI002B7B4743|nr:hypothetical protein [Mycobacterium sp.]HXB88786.1 hypothetical protein [Mycobacterium sp.]